MSLLLLFNRLRAREASYFGDDVGFWYDASDVSTITKDGSDRVEQWNDKGPGNNHATQTNNSQKPVYTTNQINGLSILSFDGSNDQMTAANATQLTTDACTVLFAGKSTGTNGTIISQGFQYSGNEHGWSFGRGQNHDTTKTLPNSVFFGSADNDGNYNNTMVVNTEENTSPAGTTVIAAIKSGTTVEFYIDGVFSALSSTDGALATPTIAYPDTTDIEISYGYSLWIPRFTGQMSEIVGIKKKLTGKDFLGLQKYLTDKWL